jgi:hypothetical protein
MGLAASEVAAAFVSKPADASSIWARETLAVGT